jgi:hypothetical protein
LAFGVELSDTKVYEPQIRALLGTASHFYWGFGSRVSRSEKTWFGVWGFGVGIRGSGFKIWEFKVWGLGFEVEEGGFEGED